MILIIILCGLMILSATASAGNSLEEGLAAYERQEYEQAFQTLKPLAEDGNPEAQHVLGLMYTLGTGVPQDYDEATRWLTLAATEGNLQSEDALAALAISEFRKKGQATEGKQEKIKWVMSSAQRGNPESMNMLGVLYMLGNGVPLTTIEAEKWFCRSIKGRHETAARNLGLMMAGTIYYLERVKKVGDPIDTPCSSAE